MQKSASSQNHRKLRWEGASRGHLVHTLGPPQPTQAPTAGCPGPWPGSFWRSSRGETPQPSLVGKHDWWLNNNKNSRLTLEKLAGSEEALGRIQKRQTTKNKPPPPQPTTKHNKNQWARTEMLYPALQNLPLSIPLMYLPQPDTFNGSLFMSAE